MIEQHAIARLRLDGPAPEQVVRQQRALLGVRLLEDDTTVAGADDRDATATVSQRLPLMTLVLEPKAKGAWRHQFILRARLLLKDVDVAFDGYQGVASVQLLHLLPQPLVRGTVWVGRVLCRRPGDPLEIARWQRLFELGIDLILQVGKDRVFVVPVRPHAAGDGVEADIASIAFNHLGRAVASHCAAGQSGLRRR